MTRDFPEIWHIHQPYISHTKGKQKNLRNSCYSCLGFKDQMKYLNLSKVPKLGNNLGDLTKDTCSILQLLKYH